MTQTVCSFCNKNHKELNVVFIKYSTNISICDRCVRLCNSNISKTKFTFDSIITPKQIHEYLKEYVVGQDAPLSTISTILFKHIVFCNSPSYSKNNAIIIGRSGTGKSYIFETASKMFSIPMVKVNASGLTATGYHGPDVTSILEKLYSAAGSNIEKTQTGIIFLDEIDKTAVQYSRTRDITGASVQEELMTILSGETVQIFADSKSKLFGKPTTINTERILVILAGAFEGIEGIYSVKGSITSSDVVPGFTSELRKDMGLVEQALISYGMKTEFVGRVQTPVIMNELTADDFVAIIKNPNNKVLANYRYIFETYGSQFTIPDDVCNYIASYVASLPTGTRALTKILNKIMNFYIYDLDMYKNLNIELTMDDVKNHINTVNMLGLS